MLIGSTAWRNSQLKCTEATKKVQAFSHMNKFDHQSKQQCEIPAHAKVMKIPVCNPEGQQICTM